MRIRKERTERPGSSGGVVLQAESGRRGPRPSSQSCGEPSSCTSSPRGGAQPTLAMRGSAALAGRPRPDWRNRRRRVRDQGKPSTSQVFAEVVIVEADVSGACQCRMSLRTRLGRRRGGPSAVGVRQSRLPAPHTLLETPHVTNAEREQSAALAHAMSPLAQLEIRSLVAVL